MNPVAILEATSSAKTRGHSITWGKPQLDYTRVYFIGECSRCKRKAVVVREPHCEDAIAGDALTKACTGGTVHWDTQE